MTQMGGLLMLLFIWAFMMQPCNCLNNSIKSGYLNFCAVCDELMLGIPVFAWWVGIAALLCILLASLAPLVLPLHKLLNYEGSDLSKAVAAKMS